MPIVEMSSKKYKNGKRPFTATLYKLQPPESVVDGVGTLFNNNGITFLEKYAQRHLDSIKDMSVCVAFLDDERTIESDHGDTGYDNGMPVFENATVVGHFTRGYIDNVEINGVMERCVMGDGYIDEMRYPQLVKSLEQQIQTDRRPHGSIEIFRPLEDGGIVYLKGRQGRGRIPVEYEHTGWDIVLNPADDTSVILEINSKNKEDAKSMNETEMKNLIKATLLELNNNNSAFTNEINELNETLAQKDKELCDRDTDIVDYTKKIAELEQALEDCRKEREDKYREYDRQIDELEAEAKSLKQELGNLKAQKRIAEMETALTEFSEAEKAYAVSEINAFKESPLDGDIDAIKAKICVGIVENQRASEINSQKGEGMYGDVFDDNDMNTDDYDMY